MTLDKIRDKVNNYINKDVHFIYNGSRNQIDEFNGKVINTYKFVFVIMDENNVKKSFSYTDILIGNLVLQ